VVRRVLERWRDLCDTFGVAAGFPHDQPFLTMAFEQSTFLPYVLSPAYNYRSMGEYAVGNVRIWHSGFPLPADLNVFDQAWPARRFIDGVRARNGNSERIQEVPLQPPMAMLRLILPGHGAAFGATAARSIAEAALGIQKRLGSREAAEYLLRHVDCGVAASLDDHISRKRFPITWGSCTRIRCGRRAWPSISADRIPCRVRTTIFVSPITSTYRA
jgi:hypothetical protein